MSKPKQRAPTLYAIIVIKLAKGLLLLSTAAAIYRLANTDVSAQFQSWLRSLGLNPEQKLLATLTGKLNHVTPANVYSVAFLTAFYSLFSLVEGFGLCFRISWAGWMAIGESAFFIPLELYDLSHGISVKMLVILALNVVIMWYLLQNRHRLFHHLKQAS